MPSLLSHAQPITALALIGLLTLVSVPGEAQTEPEPVSLDLETQLALAEAFLRSPDSGLDAGSADSFEPAAVLHGPDGTLAARFDRYHHGLRLLGASVKVIVAPTEEVGLTVSPPPLRPPASLTPAVRVEEVWSIAAEALQVAPDDIFGDLELVLLPAPTATTDRLVWWVHAFHPEVPSLRLEIDAQTGDVIDQERGHVEASVNAEGTGFMRPRPVAGPGPEEVELDTLLHDHTDTYFLVDHSRGGTKVLDMRDRAETIVFKGVDYLGSDNEWGNGEDWQPSDDTDSETGETAAVEALWGAQRTWDTFLNTLNLSGLDGFGKPIWLRVHYRDEAGERYNDANYDGRYANFGDLQDPSGWSRTHFVTVAHEMGHGIWHELVSARNKDEADGLNEGHSDIAGAVVAHYVRLAEGLGPTIPTTATRGDLSYFRDRMVNPWEYSSEGDTGQAAYVAGMENIEEHCQGTAYGHMFAILAMGIPAQPEVDAGRCTGRSYICLGKASFPLGMAGIGVDKAARIWLWATAAYFDNDPTFHEARDAWLQAADHWYGRPSAEYAAVMNAFHLINVGDPAEDVFPPEVSTLPPIVDDDEGSVLVELEGFDDIGVVRVEARTEGDSIRVFGHRLKAYLEAGYRAGPKTLDVRATDGNSTSTEQSIPFDYHAANRLFFNEFENPAFRSGSDWYANGWLLADRAMVRAHDPAGAFLGEGYLSFSGDQEIESKVTIPAAATDARLGYRFRVRPGLNATQGELRIEIRDVQGNLLETVQAIGADRDTTLAFGHDYLKTTYPINLAYAGQKLVLRIAAKGAEDDAFRIDQFYVAYDATPIADLNVAVDEREGSVIMEANVVDIDERQMESMQFIYAGAEMGRSDAWPHSLVRSTSEFPVDVEASAGVMVLNYFGVPVAASPFVPFTVSSTPQLITNGGFESDSLAWSMSGDVAPCIFEPAAGQSHPSFIGSGCIAINGSGTLSQAFWLPLDLTSASLSFRLANGWTPLSTGELTVRILNDATGAELAVPFVLDAATTDTTEGDSYYSYRKYVIDLAPYQGTTLRIEFAAEDHGDPIYFRIDNVGATYYEIGGVTD